MVNSNMENFGGSNTNYGVGQNSVNYSGVAESQSDATTTANENTNAEPMQRDDSTSTTEKYEEENPEERPTTAENDDATSENIKKKKTMLEKLDRHINGDDEKSSDESNSDDNKKGNSKSSATFSGDSQEFQETGGDNSSSSAVFSDDAEWLTSEESTESELNQEEYVPNIQDNDESWKNDDASLHNIPLGKKLPERSEHGTSSDEDRTSQDRRLSSKDF
jgi:hypothetical protein